MTAYRRIFGDGLKMVFRDLFKNRQLNRGAVRGLMIVGALLAFEVFNFSTTQFALRDMLGDLTFAGVRWATILAIAPPVELATAFARPTTGASWGKAIAAIPASDSQNSLV